MVAKETAPRSLTPSPTSTRKLDRKVCKREKKDDSVENVLFIFYIFIFLLSLKTRPTMLVVRSNELSWKPMEELQNMTKFWYLLSGLWTLTTLLTWLHASFSLSTCLTMQFVESIIYITGNLPALRDIGQTHGAEAASLAHLTVAMCHGQFLLLLITGYVQWATYREESNRKKDFLVVVAVWLGFILLARAYLPALSPEKPEAYGDVIVWGSRVLVWVVVIMMIDAGKLLVAESRPSLNSLIAIVSLLVILAAFHTFGHDVYLPYLDTPSLL